MPALGDIFQADDAPFPKVPHQDPGDDGEEFELSEAARVLKTKIGEMKSQLTKELLTQVS